MSRVLVVDDDRTQRLLLTRWLKAMGYEVAEAGDGQEALGAFEEGPPELVLLDALMPHMDGFETARRMRTKAPYGRLLQILMITALDDEKSLIEGLEAGADDFVSKPLSRTLLRARIGSLARAREMFDAVQQQARTLERLAEDEQQKQAMAARLMSNLLSSRLLQHPAFQVRTSAMEAFNGDLVMAAPLGPRAFRIVFGDFSGHGLEAAVGSLPVATDFERACAQGESMATFLDAALLRLRRVIPRHRFLALAVVDVDLEARRAHWLNAGMPDLLHVGAHGLRRLGSTHPPLGVLPPPLLDGPPATLELSPGDLLYFQTDGLMETENPAGAQFGRARLEDELAACEGELDRVLASLERFRGATPARDDATVMRLRFDPEMRWEARGGVRPGRGPSCARCVDSLEWTRRTADGCAPIERP